MSSLDPSINRTGAAVPSDKPLDIQDDSLVFDTMINDTSGQTVLDRKGIQRETYQSAINRINNDANEVIDSYRQRWIGDYTLPNKVFLGKGDFVTWAVGDGGDGNAYVYIGPESGLPYFTDVDLYPDPNSDPNLQFNPTVTALYVNQVGAGNLSQGLGGNVWPIEYDQSAQVGDTGLSGVRYLRDAVNNVLYRATQVLSGEITALSFPTTPASEGTATVGGSEVSLYRFDTGWKHIKASDIPGVIRPLTRSEIISTDPIIDPSADSTAAINSFLSDIPEGSIYVIELDGTYGISSTLEYINKNVIWSGLGYDVEGSGLKWLPGRNITNENFGFFTVRGSRFVYSGDFRLIPPACYAPSNPSYDARHTLGWAFNEIWRQEEGDRVSSTLSYGKMHIGRYDADGWPAEFRERECRCIKYGFWTPDEMGFNNDGNNDFHQFDTIVMFHVDVAVRIENRQNLGWRFKNLQFFFGTSVDQLPVGGLIYYENLWVAGTTGTDGVFLSGTPASTGEIARRYIHNFNGEGIRNDHLIEAVGDSVVTKISGGGSVGFRTNEGNQAYCDLVKMTGTVRSDIRIDGIQILEDTGSGDTADFRLRYDTNSKENVLNFEGCWGDYYESTSFQTGSSQGWSVQFSDVKPAAINRRTDFSQNGSYSYLVNYSDDNALRDGFGRIPLENIYNVGYMQQISALAVGRLGVDALTVVESKTFRIKPFAATAFFVNNIFEPGWRVIGLSAYFIYNDLGASYFKVLSGDGTPFDFGGGVSNGSGADRIAPLTDGENGMLFVDNLRLRFEGYSDSAFTNPAAFSGGGSGITDSTTIAVTVHYISLDRKYLDIVEYNKLDITDPA